MSRLEARIPSTAVISAQHVRLAHDRQRIPLPGEAQGAEPSIDVIRDGDIIVAVEVACSCGQRVRLRFDYPADAGAQS